MLEKEQEQSREMAMERSCNDESHLHLCKVHEGGNFKYDFPRNCARCLFETRMCAAINCTETGFGTVMDDYDWYEYNNPFGLPWRGNGEDDIEDYDDLPGFER